MNIPLTVLMLDCETGEAEDKISTLSHVAHSLVTPVPPALCCDDLEEICPTIQRLFEATTFTTAENIADSNSCDTTRSEHGVTVTCSNNSANLAVTSTLLESRDHTASQHCWSGEVIPDVVSDLLMSAGSSDQLPGHGRPLTSTCTQYEEQKRVHLAPTVDLHNTRNHHQEDSSTDEHKAIARKKNRQAAQRFRDRKKEESKDLEKRVKLLWRTRRLWQVVYSLLHHH